MKVLVFVGTRADLFPLGPVLVQLEALSTVELHVATAIGFAPETAAIRLSEAGLIANYHHHDLGLFLDATGPGPQSARGSELVAGFAGLLAELQPDAVVVLGDRWELMFVTAATVLRGTRLIHLHGGEVTEGALDERVRHAVSKLADQHCVSTAAAARRVRQLGESPERIHQTGAPGLDRFTGVAPLSVEEFREAFGTELIEPLILVTYHPPTAEVGIGPGVLANAVFTVALQAPGTAILTYPGYDDGRGEIIDELQSIAARAEPGGRVIVRESLGPLYPRTMATASLLLGNSSSGILEAASFGLPVVNVGTRQQGREHGPNVLDAPDGDAGAISNAVAAALDPDFRASAAGVVNPYGNGHSAERIVAVILNSGDTPLTKSFIDVATGE